MNLRFKRYTAKDLLWALLALTVGTLIVYFSGRLLNVSMEVYYGVSTYNILWVISLIVVPFIAGLFVSFIYGLGGKILAHFAPLIVRCYEYYIIDTTLFPDGVSLLPLGFWILIVIVTVEAAGMGGFVGEVIIKRTYGRSPKHKFHKRYQSKKSEKADLGN